MWSKYVYLLKTVRDESCQNENRQIMYEITGLEQKQPKNFQDALHNNYF